MLETKSVLWSVEFHTNAFKSDASIIQLGFLREAMFDGNARFLGMIFRTCLTPAELDKINLHTWPELENLERFMDNLFDEGWDVCSKAVDDDFASIGLAKRFSGRSALLFRSLNVPECRATSTPHLIKHLIDSLDALDNELEPRIVAPVVMLELPGTSNDRLNDNSDVHGTPKLRLAA